VGHSAGGLHIRLFSIRYPEEVADLVFVDPAHEHLWIEWKRRFPDIYETWLRENDERSPGGGLNEWLAFKAELPDFGMPGPPADVPLVVLTALKPEAPFYTAEFDQAFLEILFDAHELLARSVTNGTHTATERSGHYIHREEPQLVIDAIRQVAEAVR